MHKYFSPKLPKTLGQILQIVGGECEIVSVGISEKEALDTSIESFASLRDAKEGQLSFFADIRYVHEYYSTKASFIIVPNESKFADLERNNVVLIKVDNPMSAYIKLLHAIYENADYYNLIGSEGFSAEYAKQMSTVSNSATIGEGSIISPQCFIGRGVSIGKNCSIGPQVSITHAQIGDNCVIHAGAKIGTDGFGCFRHQGQMVYIKQIGGVVVGSNVSIGANCTIDRGALSNTIVESHCSLDNMVHIAHNVELGEGIIIAALTGIAGSAVIGKCTTIGGQVGILGHIVIGEHVTIAAQSGVIKPIPAKKVVAGAPAVDVNLWRRSCVALKRLAKK